MRYFKKHSYMKKYLLGFIISTSFCLAASAQSKFTLGPTVGLGYTTIKNTSKSEGKLAASFGAALVYNMSENFGIGLDGKFSVQGERTELNDVRYIRTLNYLQFPLKAIYSFTTSNERIRPIVYAGPSFGFLVGGKTKVNELGEDTKVYWSKDLYKTFDFGIKAGGGVNYQLDDYTWLSADVSYLHGLSNLVKDTRAHNRTMLVNLGVNFSL